LGLFSSNVEEISRIDLRENYVNKVKITATTLAYYSTWKTGEYRREIKK